MKPAYLCLFASLISLTAAHAELFTHLTAEGGTIAYDIRKDPVFGFYTEPPDHYRSQLTFKQGERNTAAPVLVGTIQTTTNEHYLGTSAFQIEIIARNESANSAKAAYKASIDSVGGHDRFTPPVAKSIDWYHGFVMKIDPTYYRLPDEGELLFEQWWQGSPFHPPISLVIVNPKDAAARGWTNGGTNGNFALILRDDDHNADESFPGRAQFFDLGPVVVGQWLRWVVSVRPSPVETNGSITITLDGREKLKLEHIKVGYDPANPQYHDHKPSNRLASVNVCLYRLNGRNLQRLYFDELKFSDRYDDAVTP
jgi:hypothetical protein